MYLTDNDEITMKLVHYFITEENYQPIIVQGSDNEIWLENMDKPYSVIRINANYIHNNEQLQYDLYKSKAVIKQIKRKTLSFSISMLNIVLNLGDNVKPEDFKDKVVEILPIASTSDEKLLELFPEIANDKVDEGDSVDFFLNVTKDINEVTEKKNKIYEKIFKKKTILVTYLLIIANVLLFLYSSANPDVIYKYGMNGAAFKAGEYYRVITAAFFHGGLVHLFCNMYSLYIIGNQVENLFGKLKFLLIYLISAICGSLLSGLLSNSLSIGASGAIFGLLGCLTYFGYHYRLFLGNTLLSNIVPVIIINLLIGFSLSNVDNYAHIGGLIGGVFSSMMVGIEGKSDKTDRINGTIVTIAFIAFMVYMVLFR